jgi:PadR family transcriptional regulator PadR
MLRRSTNSKPEIFLSVTEKAPNAPYFLTEVHFHSTWLRSQELARHGYRLSPGTLYPMLHRLEQKGYLRSSVRRKGREARRVYRATRRGRKMLEAAKMKVQELFGELFED